MDDLRLRDRHEIQECLFRYVRGVDRRNWDLVRSAYHPDAYDDHGNYKGNIDIEHEDDVFAAASAKEKIEKAGGSAEIVG